MTAPTTPLPALIQALLDPAAYPHPVSDVTLVQTHVSYILLAGAYAYKVKKPLDLGFLDFSNLAQREYFCQREIELNRRLCPTIYLGVVPITQVAGRARIGGDGPPCEWAVMMRRLPADQMLTARLAANQVTADDVRRIAHRLAEFHASGLTGHGIDALGSREAIQYNVDENFAQLHPFIGRTISADQYDHLRAYSRAFLTQRAPLFTQRIARGRIRDGHGDLHAGSICLTDPVIIFDCIEFNDRFRCGDVAAEVAFLAMDLDHHGRADLAWHFVHAYQQATGDDGLVALLDFYKCYRALVRCKVESLRSEQNSFTAAERAAALTSARSYGDLAFTYAGGIARPALLITCGLMATGKTTLAQALASRLALVHLSADVTRKRLAGLRPEDHRDVAFGADIYSAAFSRRVYTALLAEAHAWLRRGCSVVLDASFKRAAERARARGLAAALDLPFLAVECTCAENLIQARVKARRTGSGTVSDARWELFPQQRADFDPCRELADTEHMVVDTTEAVTAGIDQVRDRLTTLTAGRVQEDLASALVSGQWPHTPDPPQAME